MFLKAVKHRNTGGIMKGVVETYFVMVTYSSTGAALSDFFAGNTDGIQLSQQKTKELKSI